MVRFMILLYVRWVCFSIVVFVGLYISNGWVLLFLVWVIIEIIRFCFLVMCVILVISLFSVGSGILMFLSSNVFLFLIVGMVNCWVVMNVLFLFGLLVENMFIVLFLVNMVVIMVVFLVVVWLCLLELVISMVVVLWFRFICKVFLMVLIVIEFMNFSIVG